MDIDLHIYSMYKKKKKSFKKKKSQKNQNSILDHRTKQKLQSINFGWK